MEDIDFQLLLKLFESYSNALSSIITNLKAIRIILEKFQLFNAGYNKDYDIAGYGGVMGCGNANIRPDFKTGVDFVVNSHLYGDVVTLPSNESHPYPEFNGIIKYSQRPSSPSLLIDLLNLNYPGMVALYLQRQSNRLLQLISEIRVSCNSISTERNRNLIESCRILLNRNINSLNYTVSEDVTNVSLNLLDIVARIDLIYEFCVKLDSYPTIDVKILSNLDDLISSNI